MTGATTTRLSTLLCMAGGMIVYVNCKASGATVNFVGRDMTCDSVRGMAIFTGAIDVVNAKPGIGLTRKNGLRPTEDAASTTGDEYIYYESDERRTPVTVSYDCVDFTANDGTPMVDFGTLTFSAGGDQGRALVRIEVALNGASIDDCINPEMITPELYKSCVHAVRDIAIVKRTERNVQMMVYGVCSGSKGVCGKNGASQTTCVDTSARGNSLVASKRQTQNAACRDATITEEISAIPDDPVVSTPSNPDTRSPSSSGNAADSSGANPSDASSSSASSTSSTSSASSASSASSTSSGSGSGSSSGSSSGPASSSGSSSGSGSGSSSGSGSG